jgi:hypothetical protein
MERPDPIIGHLGKPSTDLAALLSCESVRSFPTFRLPGLSENAMLRPGNRDPAPGRAL